MKRALIALPLSLGLTLLGVLAYDVSQHDLIASGTSVAGVPVGGLAPTEAAVLLERRFEAVRDRPIVVRHQGRRFVLSPSDVGLGVDTEATAQRAFRRSRADNPFTRTLALVRRDGRPSVGASVSYSRPGLEAFVRRVARRVDRPARNATVRPAGARLRRIRSRAGRRLSRGELRRRLARALASPAERQGPIPATTQVERPRVTTRELASRYPHYVAVDREAFRLRYYRRLRLVKTYTIAVGQVGFDTPAGLYRIQNKAINPAWSVPEEDWAGELAGRVIPAGSPENPIKARWMGIYDGAGIHGTNETASLGSRASHGCIRMAIPEVKELYRRVEVQTPVWIS